jgi:hypothetical protein
VSPVGHSRLTEDFADADLGLVDRAHYLYASKLMLSTQPATGLATVALLLA